MYELLMNNFFKKIRKEVVKSENNNILLSFKTKEHFFSIEIDEFENLSFYVYFKDFELLSCSFESILNDLKSIYKDTFLFSIDIDSVQKYFINFSKNKEFNMNNYYRDCIIIGFFYIIVRYVYSCIKFDRIEIEEDNILQNLSLFITNEAEKLLDFFNLRDKKVAETLF